MNDLTSPEYWRSRAEEARTYAEQFADRHAKKQMLEVAAGYDRMAAMAEKINLLKGGPKKP